MFGNLANMLKNRTNRFVDAFLLIIDRTYIDVESLSQANLALNFVVGDGICLVFAFVTGTRTQSKAMIDDSISAVFPAMEPFFSRSELYVLRSMTPFRGFEATSSESDLSNAIRRNPRRKEKKVSDATCNTTKNERIVNCSIMWSR